MSHTAAHPTTTWIRSLHQDSTASGAQWFWFSLTPKTALYEVPWTERGMTTARWSDEEYVRATSATTTRLFKAALHKVLDEIDPMFSRNHPERTKDRARLAVVLVPALCKRISGRDARYIRVLHYHGWVVLNPPRTTPSSRKDQSREVTVRQDEVDITIACPRPVALLVDHLKVACGGNLNLHSAHRIATPETPDLLATHAAYATRTSRDEKTFPLDLMDIPHWYWTHTSRSVVA